MTSSDDIIRHKGIYTRDNKIQLCYDRLGTVYEKEEEVDQRPGITLVFEHLVEIRSLLNYMDWRRMEKHGDPVTVELLKEVPLKFSYSAT